MQTQEFIQKFAIHIANEPQTGAQAPRVFYVGGTVRDRIRGSEEMRDVDLEVYGVPADRIQEIIEEITDHPIDVLGAAFGVYKLTCDDGVLDIALPRAESKKGKGHKGFVITGDPYLSFIDALRRRDFTMNAILCDVLTEEIIDPYQGQDDIVHGVLRVVDIRTFVDDPLRIYRGMQFVARFDLTIDEESMRLFQRMAVSSELATLSPERVTEEWKKMLRAEHPEKGLRFLEQTGLLARYPELDILRTTPQDPNWHPEGSVWEHVVKSVGVGGRGEGVVSEEKGVILREIPSRPKELPETDHEDVSLSSTSLITFRLALLLHDIGKGVVTKKVKNKISDEGHAQAGVALAKTFFDRFTFGDRCEKDVIACIQFHEILPELYRRVKNDELTEAQSVNALRMLWRDVGVDRVPLFLAVCEANARGRDLPLDDRPYPVRVWAEELSRRYALFHAAAEPLLSGTDLQNIAARLHISLSTGKAFGMLLANVESARDRGEIVTRNEAIEYLEKSLVGSVSS